MKKQFNHNVYGDIPYWKIRTDRPYLEISLDKLNLPEKQQKYILNNPNITTKNFDGEVLKYVYIPDSTPDVENYYASWNPCRDEKKGNKNFNESGYVYKGELEITQKDIDDYNVAKGIVKFNI
jgi:hypothetical protein